MTFYAIGFRRRDQKRGRQSEMGSMIDLAAQSATVNQSFGRFAGSICRISAVIKSEEVACPDALQSGPGDRPGKGRVPLSITRNIPFDHHAGRDSCCNV